MIRRFLPQHFPPLMSACLMFPRRAQPWPSFDLACAPLPSVGWGLESVMRLTCLGYGCKTMEDA